MGLFFSALGVVWGRRAGNKREARGDYFGNRCGRGCIYSGQIREISDPAPNRLGVAPELTTVDLSRAVWIA